MISKNYKKNYKPNFNYVRVVDRCKNALVFVSQYSLDEEHEIPKTKITEYFGIQNGTSDLAIWLKTLLLKCNDEYFRIGSKHKRGQCKKYIIRKEGVELLKDALANVNVNVNINALYEESITEKYINELTSGNFTYNKLSNRYWHGLQNVKKEVRTKILNKSGYIYDYDIQCCAPTLLYQFAKQNGLTENLTVINSYIKDRNTIRNELANDLGLTPKVAKEVINALFAGAKLTYTGSLFELLGSKQAVDAVKSHKTICAFVSELKVMWDAIKPKMNYKNEYITKHGEIRAKSPTCKDKWNKYFELEITIINAVRAYLSKRNVRYFLMHDGWATDKKVNINALIKHIKTETKFKIKVDSNVISESRTKTTTNDKYMCVAPLLSHHLQNVCTATRRAVQCGPPFDHLYLLRPNRPNRIKNQINTYIH